jgi:hypothetical protein
MSFEMRKAFHGQLPIFLLAACCFAPYQRAEAQSDPSAEMEQIVSSYLKEHALELRLSEGRLAGPAADWLRSEAAKAQFLFVGEEHDVREIPLIAGALWRELVPLGYKHVGIEAGPWLGDRLDRFARFGDRQALAQFQAATWPRLPNNSVPPISEEDLNFYELLGALSGPHRQSQAPLIWGLDNEYRATPLLKRLTELPLNPGRRSQIESLRLRVEAAEKMGDYDTRAFRSEIKGLMISIPAKPGTELFQLFEGLNWRIMEPSEREVRNVEKDLFRQQYQAAKQKGEAAPRVMFRFGGLHSPRGLSPNSGVSTLANMIAELGTMEGARMLNVSFVNCQAHPTADFPRPCSWEQAELLKPFRAATAGPWTLFDLRGLREPMRRIRVSAADSPPNTLEQARKALNINPLWSLVMRQDALVLLNASEHSHISPPR